MTAVDLFTTTVDAAAAHAQQYAEPADRPELADARDDSPRLALPDPYRCIDPWCPNATRGVHQHGTRPDGVRV